MTGLTVNAGTEESQAKAKPRRGQWTGRPPALDRGGQPDGGGLDTGISRRHDTGEYVPRRGDGKPERQSRGERAVPISSYERAVYSKPRRSLRTDGESH